MSPDWKLKGMRWWVDTVFTETPPEGDNQALWYLGKSLQAIAGVDAVYFMDGWDKARGCRIEYEACVLYGIRTLNTDILLQKPLLDFMLGSSDNLGDWSYGCEVCGRKEDVVMTRDRYSVQLSSGKPLIILGETHVLCKEHIGKCKSITQKFITLYQLYLVAPEKVFNGIKYIENIQKILYRFQQGMH